MNNESMTENQRILYRATERVREQESYVRQVVGATELRRAEFERFMQKLDTERSVLAELKRELAILEAATGETLQESEAA